MAFRSILRAVDETLNWGNICRRIVPQTPSDSQAERVQEVATCFPHWLVRWLYMPFTWIGTLGGFPYLEASRGRRSFFANVKLERVKRSRHMTSDRTACNLFRYRHTQQNCLIRRVKASRLWTTPPGYKPPARLPWRGREQRMWIRAHRRRPNFLDFTTRRVETVANAAVNIELKWVLPVLFLSLCISGNVRRQLSRPLMRTDVEIMYGLC